MVGGGRVQFVPLCERFGNGDNDGAVGDGNGEDHRVGDKDDAGHDDDVVDVDVDAIQIHLITNHGAVDDY